MRSGKYLPHLHENEREGYVKRLAEHYKQRGYSVGACCSGFEPPSRTAGLVPHVQLMKDEIGISIIEVLTKETVCSAESIKRLQAFSKSHVSMQVAYPEELRKDVERTCRMAKLKTVKFLPLTKEGIFGLQ